MLLRVFPFLPLLSRRGGSYYLCCGVLGCGALCLGQGGGRKEKVRWGGEGEDGDQPSATAATSIGGLSPEDWHGEDPWGMGGAWGGRLLDRATSLAGDVVASPCKDCASSSGQQQEHLVTEPRFVPFDLFVGNGHVAASEGSDWNTWRVAATGRLCES